MRVVSDCSAQGLRGQKTLYRLYNQQLHFKKGCSAELLSDLHPDKPGAEGLAIQLHMHETIEGCPTEHLFAQLAQ